MIVHLAAGKIPRYGDALDTLVINGEGGLGVLRACRDTACARMVLASTSDCYGRNPDVPFSEESVSVIGGPHVRRWSYAVSKMFEEQALFAFRERHGLEGVILRLFGGYGPRQNMTWWGGPQSVFIGAALKGEELELHGTGQQTRSFTYVSDMVEGFVRAVDVPAADGEMLNIGADREITIEGLARMVWGLVRDDEPRDQDRAPGHLRQLRGRAAPDPRQPAGHARPRLHAAGHPRGGARPHDRVAARGDGARRPAVIHVVVPAFNEAGNIAAMLGPVRERLEPLAVRHRIVVVDDGSTDGTARGLRARPPPPGCPWRSSRHGANRGPGAAFRTGFLHVLRDGGSPRPRGDAGRRPDQRPLRPAAPAPPRVGGGRPHRARLLLPLRRRHQGHAACIASASATSPTAS